MPDWVVVAGVVASFLTAIFTAIGVAFYIGRWTGRVNTVLSSFEQSMTEVRQDIKRIFERLPPPTTSDGSPLRLTGLGEEIADTLESKGWAWETASSIVDKVEGLSNYQIQEFCSRYVREEIRETEELSRQIDECAYEKGIQRDKVLDVLMVELRDAVLDMKTENES